MIKRWIIGDIKVHMVLSGEGLTWSDMTPTPSGNHGFGLENFHISVVDIKVKGL